MGKYSLEFILSVHDPCLDVIRESLSQYGEDLKIAPLAPGENEKGDSFKINIRARDPTLVFDICAQLGRFKSVKINEE
ncbi:MAG: hypothetical protein JW788_00085 [Candidatus Omnitrophica bacterium]|nr:hypothetical protein [Candidatus Omnitrophota bacterium]